MKPNFDYFVLYFFYTHFWCSQPRRWLAPEVFEFKKFSFASDVWAYVSIFCLGWKYQGITLWELYSKGKLPFSVMNTVEIGEFVTSGKQLEIPPECPPVVESIMKKCWTLNATERPNFTALSSLFSQWSGRYYLVLQKH